MAVPGGGIIISFFLWLVVLISLFLGAPNLCAIPSQSSSTGWVPGDVQAHFHQKELLQPAPQKPLEMKQKESLRLDVTGAQLSCSEDDCSHHRSCNLKIAYRLSSRGDQEFNVGAQVVCQARLNYTTSHGYHLKSERCSSPVAHTLQHQVHLDSTLVVEFQFSPYEQVVDAQVEAIQCHIEQAEIILNSAFP